MRANRQRTLDEVICEAKDFGDKLEELKCSVRKGRVELNEAKDRLEELAKRFKKTVKDLMSNLRSTNQKEQDRMAKHGGSGSSSKRKWSADDRDKSYRGYGGSKDGRGRR